MKIKIARTLAVAAALTASIVACGGGGDGSPTAPPPTPAPGTRVVQVIDNAYTPQQVVVQPGTTVRWVMRGSDPGHTVTARNGAFDSGFVFHADGDVFEHTFTQADLGSTFEYSCASHQGCCQMQGSVRVGQNAPPPAPGY